MVHKSKHVALPPSLIMQFYVHERTVVYGKTCNKDPEDVDV